MRVEPDKAILITRATVGLHNFIRHRDGNMIDRTSSIVYEIRDNTGRDGLFPLAQTGCRAAEDAMKVRDALSEFFTYPSFRIPLNLTVDDRLKPERERFQSPWQAHGKLMASLRDICPNFVL
ncbi:hypothetical protein PoB_001979900 [Plakobranchus ocellatus]|uniref:Uncharacterized protein n=1 Tax=Plakobranchus ocellatus TaxID=259542 RepID=A0AAV3ZHC7_9GAST|nr:hypothetical protein PoB_001979900 [Plakobranchus ocellatus]